MEADRHAIIIVLTVGIFLGVLLSLSVSVFTGPYEKATEEQESIQEEEMEIIHTQEISLWCEMVVVHDNQRNVTCWCYQGGLVCIPDHMISP